MLKHKVKMLSTQMGVHDGELHPVAFVEGAEHEIGPDLLQGFISLGAVELLDQEIAPRELAEGEMLVAGDLPEGSTATEAKSEGEATENKALTAAPENKKRKK
jgi:hypothetical protein